MKPMPLDVFFALKPGDQYRVTWAKDDDYKNGLRLDYELQTVSSNDGSTIYPTDGGYEWSKSESSGDNTLDTSRGYAYLYYP